MAPRHSTGTRTRQRGVELLTFQTEREIIYLIRMRRRFGSRRLREQATDETTIVLPVRRGGR